MAGVNPALAAYRAGGGASGVKPAAPSVHPSLATYRNSVKSGVQYDQNYTPPDTSAPAPKPASHGSWGGIFSTVKNFVGNDIVKPVVDSAKSVYHVGRAAADVAGSVVEGHHGAQLAQDKQRVINEFKGSSIAKVAPETVSGTVNPKTAKLENAQPITGTTIRKAAGAVGEDALNLGSLAGGGEAVAKGVVEAGAKSVGKKLLTEGVKTGAKYGTGYGVTNTLKQDKVTVGGAIKNVAEGAAIGGVAGGLLEGAGKVAGNLAGKGAKAATSAVSKTPEGVSNAIVTRVAPVAEGDTKQSILNRTYVAKHYASQKAAVQQLAQGMSEKDIKLIESIETPTKDAGYAAGRVNRVAAQADNPDQFKAVVGAMREAYNGRLASDKVLGRDVGFVHNYLPHIYDKGDKATAQALDRLRLTADSTPGYVKGRIIPTYAEADRLAAEKGLPQLKRANANVLQDFYQSMDRAASDHGSAVLKQGLEQAHPGVKVGVGKIGFDPESGQHYEQLKVTGGKNLSLPSELAAQYNKRAPAEKSTGALKVYDKVNTGAKTTMLSGGLFHSLTTMGSSAGQQLVRGALHPTEIPHMAVHNLRVIGGTFSKDIHAANQKIWSENGVTDFSNKVGVMLGDANPDVAHVHVPVISNIHDMIFKRQIPSVKQMIIEQEMQHKFPGIDFHNPTPEQIAWGRDVANGVNNLGYINRAVEGLSPKAAKQLGRVILAPDYTEGKFRTIFNAINVTKNGPKERVAREMVVGKSILFALPGLAALTAAGKIDWNDPKDVAQNITEQLLDPQVSLGFKGAPSKTNPDGTPQSVHLPTTFVSELGKVFKPMFEPNGGSRTAGLEQYATNRVAALPGIAAKLKTNKDYYGNPIYGSDAAGNPLGAGKTIENLAALGGPIPVQQGIKQASGQQKLETTLLNIAGGRVSNDTNSIEAGNSAAVSKMQNAFYAANGTAKNSPAYNYKSVSKQYLALVAANKINQAHRLAQDWNAHLQTISRAYPAGQGPINKATWDARWKSLELKTSSRADQTRAKNAKTNATLLNLSQ